MQRLRRTLAAFLAACLLLAGIGLGASAAGTGFTVKNPYAGVDWGTDKPWRGNLHTHTTLSDGNNSLADMVERHYELGYDFLAITDHGTVDRSWTELNNAKLIQTVLNLTKDGDRAAAPLTQARWQAISAGAGRDGRGMLRVPFGNEQNPTSLNNAHVNSWFADWGHGFLGGTSDYETPVREVDKRGGLCVLNHVGRYTAQDEKSTADAYEGLMGKYYVTKIQRLLEKYPALLGIDVNSKSDGETRNDRKLWDKLLTNLAPSGRSVYGLATSDTHGLGGIDTGFIWALMPANTVENLKASLKTGAFFAASHDIKNPGELAQWAEETGLTLGSEWKADREADEPMVTKITVEAGKITLETDNALAVHWVSDGKVVAKGPSIELSACEGLGAYVRAELFGNGGVLYTQPFLLEYDGMPAGSAVPWYFFDFGGLLAVFRRVALWFM
ncbi:MAG: PHP domain-containing protein [Firmicutes bacterium]|nr:PHP domain-containing protein [Bacillota bacterium]